jgi:ATP-binding cassette subfamily F protein 3
MIKVTNVTKSYGGQKLFDDASFSVNAKERVGLVGRNGHGKTTLFRMIIGEEQPDTGGIAIPKNYRIGHLSQHLNFTKASILEEGCLGLPPGQEHDAWRAEKILHGLGFEIPDMDRPPADFSGGFQVRLNLAKVLVSQPDMLLLDEPTNYLDIVSIRWLTRFLQNWKGELILITHDRSFMDGVITHTVGIHRRQIRKIQGQTDKYYDQIAMDEEIYEKTRLNQEKRRKEVEQFIRRFRAKARLANLVQSRIKTLQKQERRSALEKIETLEFSFNYAPFAAKLMMEVRDLAFGYDRARQLFSGLSFTVQPDERICIVGKNGKGKTTLLKILAGVLRPDEGDIRNHPSLAGGYFEQTNTAQMDPHRTIEQELMASHPECNQQKARDIAGAMMFTGDQALKKISVLSGGEKSRVMMGKLLLSANHMLMLDEPTNHLDMESCDSLLAAIDAFEGAVILVTHNEMFLHTLATRLIVFENDRPFIYEGSYQDFLDDIGWSDDEEKANSHPKPEKPVVEEPTISAVDKKALRKHKAEIIQEKSRILKPLQEEIARLEKEIELLEKRYSEINDSLIAASTARDRAAIGNLAKEEQKIKKHTEACYHQLDRVTSEFEARSVEFEERLNEVEG